MAGMGSNVKGHTDSHDHSGHHGHDHHRRKRHVTALGEGHEINVLLNETETNCLGWKTLFEWADLDDTNDVNKEEFLQICPTILDHWIQSYSHLPNELNQNDTEATATTFNKEAYGYGTLAVAIISLTSFVGVLIIPCMKSSAYSYFMSILIAMGFGILVGDAILHLIPQALGLHEIIHNADSAHNHASSPSYLGKCIAILGAIYGLFLFEGLSHALMPDHHHSHNHDENENKRPNDKSVKDANGTEVFSKEHKTISLQTLTSHEQSDHTVMPDQDIWVEGTSDSSPTELAVKAPVICCGLKSLAIIITLGDSVHNFADGLVIGAAFASGNRGGLSTSLAILCHELPHEFGDFAILLTTGLSKKKVIILNLLSSLTAFIGLYIGLLIGSDEVTVQWTMAVTAGMFIFVALGDMMPELKTLLTTNPYKSLLFQNVGVLIGFGFIILMSVYEHDIYI